MSDQNLCMSSMYQKMLLKRMCGGKSRLGKNCEIFFNEEQSITKVKLKGLDHSTALVIGRVSKIQGFWVEQGLFHSFSHHPNFFAIFDVLSKLCSTFGTLHFVETK